MPVVFRHNGYRFFFYSNEGDPLEPVHIHIFKDGAERSAGFSRSEPGVQCRLQRAHAAMLSRIVEERREEIEKTWHDYFAQGQCSELRRGADVGGAATTAVPSASPSPGFHACSRHARTAHGGADQPERPSLGGSGRGYLDCGAVGGARRRDDGSEERGLSAKRHVLRIAVGTPTTGRPPHKAVRAAFPHTAPTLGV